MDLLPFGEFCLCFLKLKIIYPCTYIHRPTFIKAIFNLKNISLICHFTRTKKGLLLGLDY
uniref:Uncharacterized protein n=1 Tax=Meloidogyne enterolobii TaxID=390850 RepID=A0A6V7W5K0_MELEN|nr:unnamed protein product [Meloidogyne enterolobii]